MALFVAVSVDVKGLRIGIPKEYFDVDGMDPEVRSRVEQAIARLKELGAEIVEVSLPHTKYAIPTYYVIATAEASTNLARFDGVRYGNRVDNPDLDGKESALIQMYRNTRSSGFGEEVQRRIMLGTYVLSSYEDHKFYHQAQKVRTLIRRDFEEAFANVDLIASPVAPETAFPSGTNSDDPVKVYLADILTTSVNLAGLPGISVPCGYSDAGLPIGLQLIGPALGEKKLLQAAHVYEQNSLKSLVGGGWHGQEPPPGLYHNQFAVKAQKTVPVYRNLLAVKTQRTVPAYRSLLAVKAQKTVPGKSGALMFGLRCPLIRS